MGSVCARPSLPILWFSFYSPTVTLVDDYSCSLLPREGTYSVRKLLRHSRVMKSAEQRWGRNDYWRPVRRRQQRPYINHDSLCTQGSDRKRNGEFQLLRYLRESSDSLFIKCILILILLCPIADLQKNLLSLKITKHNGWGKAWMERKMHWNLFFSCAVTYKIGFL